MSQDRDRLCLRLGLASAGALLLWTAFQTRNTAPIPNLGGYSILVVMLGGTGLALLVAAGLRTPPRQLRWLVLCAVWTEMALTAFLWRDIQARNYSHVVDTALYTRLASELARRGENPYTWDFNYAHELYRSSQDTATPELDGSVTRTYPYPALSFWSVALLDAAGLPGEWLIRTAAQMVMAGMIFLAAPRVIQPVILLPFMVWAGALSNLTGIGASDTIWAMLVVAMISAWSKPARRALFYGLAISYKQTPWLLAPFLLVRLWRDADQTETTRARLQRVALFAAISAGVFLVTNLPFVLWNLSAWLEAIASPLAGQLVFLSQGGLSGLTTFGYVNLPKDFYLLATLLVVTMMLVAYWRHYAALRDSFIVMPAILMWFSYRTLLIYWFYWVFPALALILIRPRSIPLPRRPAYYSAQTMAFAASVVLLLFAAGSRMATTSPIAIEPLPPYRTINGQVQRFLVQVTNRSESEFAPRFGVQHALTSLNPVPWHIDSGPAVLHPGESAVYQISNLGQLTFAASSAGQVVVTDARGNYDLRAVATIGPDTSYLWPDAIPNPEFLYWDYAAAMPIYWEVRERPFGAGAASFVHRNGHSSVRLTIDDAVPGSKQIELATAIIMPREAFGLWVYADLEAADSADYGIVFEEDGRRLVLRFAAQDRVTHESPDRVLIERAVQPRAWSHQVIDVPALYAQAGWEPPALRPAVVRGVDADFSMVTMILSLSSSDATSVYFGPIEQSEYGLHPTSLMAETLADPAAYYGRLADRYMAERNYDRALVVLKRAATLDPEDTVVAERIADLEILIETTSLP